MHPLSESNAKRGFETEGDKKRSLKDLHTLDKTKTVHKIKFLVPDNFFESSLDKIQDVNEEAEGIMIFCI